MVFVRGYKRVFRIMFAPNYLSIKKRNELGAWLFFVLILIISPFFQLSDCFSQETSSNLDVHGVFKITDKVINPNLQPLSANYFGQGNGSNIIGGQGAFEPVVYRKAVLARSNDGNFIQVSAGDSSDWGAIKSGALDGAEIRVYRIIDGKFHLIRQDKVANDGHIANFLYFPFKKKVITGNSIAVSW
ncbi:MAG: hypothetical protein AAF850_13145, partial [Pseudomonadota bacterium]